MPFAVEPVHAKGRTQKPVELPSLLAAPGACTSMDASMLEAKPLASSDCMESTPKRLVSHKEGNFFFFFNKPNKNN